MASVPFCVWQTELLHKSVFLDLLIMLDLFLWIFSVACRETKQHFIFKQKHGLAAVWGGCVWFCVFFVVVTAKKNNNPTVPHSEMNFRCNTAERSCARLSLRGSREGCFPLDLFCSCPLGMINMLVLLNDVVWIHNNVLCYRVKFKFCFCKRGRGLDCKKNLKVD